MQPRPKTHSLKPFEKQSLIFDASPLEIENDDKSFNNNMSSSNNDLLYGDIADLNSNMKSLRDCYSAGLNNSKTNILGGGRRRSSIY